jgi:hypothetical protein
VSPGGFEPGTDRPEKQNVTARPPYLLKIFKPPSLYTGRSGGSAPILDHTKNCGRFFADFDVAVPILQMLRFVCFTPRPTNASFFPSSSWPPQVSSVFSKEHRLNTRSRFLSELFSFPEIFAFAFLPHVRSMYVDVLLKPTAPFLAYFISHEALPSS